jgi:2,4-dienoyl-CoA reductase-like NADH-dependent reductase (Old Yellow Enzyme family)
MTDRTLFEPYTLGSLTLSNRIVMAPLTRNRAGAGLVPSRFAADYYAQRASAGLIITEAMQVSIQAQGYQDTPGIYTPEQIAGWRKVTDAVHAKGGRISEGKADLFAFGHHFIANPNLVERLKSGAPLAQMNPATIYGGGAEGYTDYPAAVVTADA